MKNFYAFLFIFFFFSSPCRAEEIKRYEALAEDLSRSLAVYQEFSKSSHSRMDMTGRDPLEPLTDAQGNVLSPTYVNVELAVQGIVNSGKSRVALINGKFYSEGDAVDHSRILEIRVDGVTVENEKGKTFLPLYPDSSKR